MTNAAEIVSSPVRESEPLSDPFSSDVFGSGDEASVPKRQVKLPEPAVEPEPLPAASWASSLPKISRRILESSLGNERFPDGLSEAALRAIETALGEMAFAGADDLRCRLVSMMECDLFAEAAVSAATTNFAVQVVFEPTQSYAVVLIGEGFVHRVIDKIFGPVQPTYSKRLSPIETAIAEFLAARVVARLNAVLDNEYFSIGETSMAADGFFSGPEAGAKASIEVEADGFSQVLRVLISREFLSGLRTASSIFDPNPDEKRAAKLFGTIRSVPLRAQIGSTLLDAATLSFLEPGDVVIVEESQLDFHRGSPRGELRLLAGAGNNFVLTGDIVASKNAKSGGMRVLLKDVSSREAVNDRHTARFTMEEKKPVEAAMSTAGQTDETIEQPESNEISASLENLQIRLRVELAGKKISLREVNSFRVGQVIDLERGPADSVNLVTDDSDETVAVGELVDIDGRLGVRLTKVFV